MARADLILNLVKSAARGDIAQFKKTVEAMAADERSKNHTIFADQLLAQLHVNGNGFSRTVPSTTRMLSGQFVVEVVPRRNVEDLILPLEAEQAVRELVEEQHRADLLRSYNLEPRNRILLIGPPGNGKTSLAEGIANALGVSLLVVRYEAVIGSYLGETAQRLGQVFEYARTQHCVLFFDEFDAVGKERGDLHESGEIKRVVSSLLLQIDALPSYVVVVVASNHPELLDRAVWRRFQIRLKLPMPTQQLIEEWFKRFEKRIKHTLGLTPRYLAEKLSGLSFAEIEEFGTDIVRRLILSGPNVDTKKITQQVLNQWMKRATVKADNTGERN
jgi:SpoVK/Ycf46/Vps4 family AAA+-type ATPase